MLATVQQGFSENYVKSANYQGYKDQARYQDQLRSQDLSPDGSPDVSPEGRRGGGPPDGPSDGDHGAGGLGLADGLAATLGALRRLWSTRGRSSPPKVHPEAGGRTSAKSSLLVSGDSPYADEAARLARRFSDDAPGLAQFGSSLTLADVGSVE